jgi:Zn-dependent protease/CBS domain-containing protein
MKWSFRIGSPFGIPLRVHLTFFLLLIWYGFLSWQRSQSASGVVLGLAFILTLFACVILHELGHALTARRYGIPTRDITLLPIGGVARLERMPDNPKQELWVALAGPAVNVLIVGVLYAAMGFPSPAEMVARLDVTGGAFLVQVMAANVLLVAFNLLPAFPMDGGRVLRALLAMRMDYPAATRLAASIGQGMAFLLGAVGLIFLHSPLLVIIALFVWMGAAQEANMVQMRHSLSGITVSQAMITDFRTLAPSDTLANAIELTLGGTQRDFPVVENDAVVGILMQQDMLAALSRGGQDVAVSTVMQREFEVLQASEMVETAFQRLGLRRATSAPVSSQGQLVGMITLDNIGELLAIRGALGRTHRAG